jgi:peptidoglycan/xylan/chitin deacetylase (PgdA/CDA1 family)
MTPSKIAVLSMDIEDWYHIDYIDSSRCDKEFSMLDGLDVYRELMARHEVPSSFFCVGSIAQSIAPVLREISAAGNDVGSHTQSHRRPLKIPGGEFERELETSRKILEDITGAPVEGFRAPCFSLDGERLESVIRAGFTYDSSKIAFRENRRYGRMELKGFREVRPWIFRRDGFFEFQMSTLDFLGRNLPVSGGGYLRIFPWKVMRPLIKRYLDEQSLYLLYIHPYELSRRTAPCLPGGHGPLKSLRFTTGLGGVETKLGSLIELLKERGYEFTTFSALRRRLLSEAGE